MITLESGLTMTFHEIILYEYYIIYIIYKMKASAFSIQLFWMAAGSFAAQEKNIIRDEPTLDTFL